MKLKFIASTTLAACLCYSNSVRAANPAKLIQLQAAHPLQLAQSTWGEFANEQGKFSILMPGKPNENKETDKDGAVSYSFELENKSNEYYIVNYTDIPGMDEVTPEQADQILDGAVDAFIKRPNSRNKIGKKQKISLSGNPGVEFEFLLEGVKGKGKTYLVKERLYVIIGASATQQQNVQKFLDSFKLTN